MFKSKFLQECEKRGFLYQCTNIEEFDNRLSDSRIVVAYWGTDPTGASLHVGHLFSLMMIRLFQRCGHKPIILVGGATGIIGDPSGKDKSRPMMKRDVIEQNKIGIKKSLEKFIKFGNGKIDAILVDNNDWWKDRKYIDVLRELGPFISVNRMLSFESVKMRLEKEEHMSFLEFNYMVLQSYDFYYLYDKYNCSVQMCGADQWGNVVAGVELVRRLQFKNNEEKEGVIGMSTPLLTDSNGKKVGKTEGNAIWINEDMLKPFDYFQYFRNVNDADVLRFLKIYTDFDIEYIDDIKNKDINELKKILAFEATKICHGEDVARECLNKAEKIYEEKSFEDLEVLHFKWRDNLQLFFLLKEWDICKSGGDARRFIKGGGIKINDDKIDDDNFVITKDMSDFKLSIGKKKSYRVIAD
jgi:tyrosyl-tRNA synthetase